MASELLVEAAAGEFVVVFGEVVVSSDDCICF